MQLFLVAFQQPIPFGISAILVITMIYIILRSAMTAEGGSTWVPFFLDRLDRSYHSGHLQVDLHNDLVGGPKLGEKASDYLRRQIREGRMFVGFDVDDDGLSFAVKKAGREAFIFGSDFPHEVFNAQKCRNEIEELLNRPDLSREDKEAVLSGNAARFYGSSGRGL